MKVVEEAKVVRNSMAAHSMNEKTVREWQSKDADLQAVGRPSKKYLLEGARRTLITDVSYLQLAERNNLCAINMPCSLISTTSATG